MSGVEIANYKLAIEYANKLLERECLKEPPVLASELATNVGLKVLTVSFEQINFPFKNVSGFIDSDTNTMYINADDHPRRQNFTIAHELGHYVMGHLQKAEYGLLFRKTALEKYDIPIEQEANCFAANLLVPDNFIKNVIKEYPFVTNSELASLFGVSETVIRNRRSQLGI